MGAETEIRLRPQLVRFLNAVHDRKTTNNKLKLYQTFVNNHE